jgi:CTP:molybdopterin cytidylyltransferase MocA
LAIDEIRDTPGEKVLWRTLIDSGDPRVMRVGAPTDAPLDVNTPADYQRLRRQ